MNLKNKKFKSFVDEAKDEKKGKPGKQGGKAAWVDKKTSGRNAGHRLSDGILYARKATGTDTVVEILNTDDTKAVGVRNIAAQKLDSGRDFVVDAIAFRVAKSASGITTNALLASANYTHIEDATSKVFMGATLTIEADSSKVIDELKLSAFATKNNNLVLAGYFELSEPIVLIAEETIKMTLRLPAAADGGGDYYAVEVELHGSVTLPTGN